MPDRKTKRIATPAAGQARQKSATRPSQSGGPPDVRDLALRYERFFRDVLLVTSAFALQDVVSPQFGRSRQVAHSRLRAFVDAGLLVVRQRGHYSPSLQSFDLLSPLLPPQDDSERLRRAVTRTYLERLGETAKPDPAEVHTDILASPSERPAWFFDVRAMIHPALTVDGGLMITAVSPPLEQIFNEVFPKLAAEVHQRSLSFSRFLQLAPLYHFDLDGLEASNVHVLEPFRGGTTSASNNGLLAELALNRSINRWPVALRLATREQYLELSCVLQREFPGVQGIWPQIDDRVARLRQVRALRATRWFIASHRLKQPVSLVNASRALLDIALENVNSSEDKAALSEVLQYLDSAIDDFARYVRATGDEELRLAKGLSFIEFMDVLEVVRDAAVDVSFLYAKPAGVEMRIDIPQNPPQRIAIRADMFIMREAFFNLIHNAVTHGSRDCTGPSVVVRFAVDGSTLRLFIEDRGPGLGSSQLHNFNHLAAVTAHQRVSVRDLGKFSGVMLAVLAVTSAGGNIEFENVEPSGLRVIIQFPI